MDEISAEAERDAGQNFWMRSDLNPVSRGSKQEDRISQPSSRAFSRGMLTERSIMRLSKSSPYLRSFLSQAVIWNPMDFFSRVSRYAAKSLTMPSIMAR